MNPVTAPGPSGPRPGGPAMPLGNRLEAAFLEEMLKYMGPKAREGASSGGPGEAQFQSFLTREYAVILADRMDLGIVPKDSK